MNKVLKIKNKNLYKFQNRTVNFKHENLFRIAKEILWFHTDFLNNHLPHNTKALKSYGTLQKRYLIGYSGILCYR